MRRARLSAIPCLLTLLLATSGRAQETNPLDTGPAPEAPPRAGPTWSGVFFEELRKVAIVIVPAAEKPGAFEGLIIQQEAGGMYPASGTVDEAGVAFDGSFAISSGHRFAFTLRFTAPDAMTLTTGATTYTMVRAPGDPQETLAQVRQAEQSMAQARIHGNEAAAIGALRLLTTAQTLFREADKEGDGILDYGTLEELAQVGLIDEALGSGVKQGYRFECRPGEKAPEFLWMATATAIEPGTTGSRNFVTNHAGVIYYSTTTAFRLGDPEAKIPQGATPVGR